jgi:brefeldin A-inhibited guanine nucleotide-exchange protein
MEQKALVLEALRALCSDPTMLTQLFLNYDCDFDAPNLFRNIVHSLTRLSNKPPSSSTKKDNTEDIELSLVGLEVLVMILRAFLKALNLPGGDDDVILPSATNNGRHRLQLDIGLAVRTEENLINATPTDDDTASSVLSDSSKKVTHNTNQIVEAFDRKRTVQENFETGVIKFILSGKQGLQYFIANEFVKQEARSIALFFHKHCDQLDKTQIGEILGREPDACFDKHVSDAEMGGDGFYVRVLHHYVDAMDFTGLVFDDAIRSFLSGFRLPGEAQKIDRIMEKFAERFTR